MMLLRCYSQPLLTDTSIIRTPLYYGQFVWSQKSQKSYIPYLYNTDTSVKRTLSSVPLVSVLRRFDCIMRVILVSNYRKIPLISPGAYIVESFYRPPYTYIRSGLCTRFKIDWTSLILERKFTIFLCFTLYLKAISKLSSTSNPSHSPPSLGGAI